MWTTLSSIYHFHYVRSSWEKRGSQDTIPRASPVSVTKELVTLKVPPGSGTHFPPLQNEGISKSCLMLVPILTRDSLLVYWSPKQSLHPEFLIQLESTTNTFGINHQHVWNLLFWNRSFPFAFQIKASCSAQFSKRTQDSLSGNDMAQVRVWWEQNW